MIADAQVSRYRKLATQRGSVKPPPLLEDAAKKLADSFIKYLQVTEDLSNTVKDGVDAYVEWCRTVLNANKISGGVSKPTDKEALKVLSRMCSFAREVIGDSVDIADESKTCPDLAPIARKILGSGLALISAIADLVSGFPWSDPDQISQSYQDIMAGRTKEVGEVIADLQAERSE